MDNIYTKIKKIILELNDEVIVEKTSDILENNLLDSLELVTFLVDIESEFGIEITADDFITNKLSKISDLIEFLNKEIN